MVDIDKPEQAKNQGKYTCPGKYQGKYTYPNTVRASILALKRIDTLQHI